MNFEYNKVLLFLFFLNFYCSYVHSFPAKISHNHIPRTIFDQRRHKRSIEIKRESDSETTTQTLPDDSQPDIQFSKAQLISCLGDFCVFVNKFSISDKNTYNCDKHLQIDTFLQEQRATGYLRDNGSPYIQLYGDHTFYCSLVKV